MIPLEKRVQMERGKEGARKRKKTVRRDKITAKKTERKIKVLTKGRVFGLTRGEGGYKVRPRGENNKRFEGKNCGRIERAARDRTRKLRGKVREGDQRNDM